MQQTGVLLSIVEVLSERVNDCVGTNTLKLSQVDMQMEAPTLTHVFFHTFFHLSLTWMKTHSQCIQMGNNIAKLSGIFFLLLMCDETSEDALRCLNGT